MLQWSQSRFQLENISLIKIFLGGTSLEVQWVRFFFPIQGVWDPFLVGELNSHLPLGQKIKTPNRSSIVTNSINTLNGPHLKFFKKGLPWWLSWWRIRLHCGRPGFDPWVGKIPWKRERLPTPVFWPGEFHGLYRPWGHKASEMTERLSPH